MIILGKVGGKLVGSWWAAGVLMVWLLPAAAQTVTASAGGITKTVVLVPAPKTLISKVLCNKLDPQPRETINCAVTISRAAGKGGYRVNVTMPNTVDGPGAVTVPEGATGVAFWLTRNVVKVNTYFRLRQSSWMLHSTRSEELSTVHFFEDAYINNNPLQQTREVGAE